MRNTTRSVVVFVICVAVTGAAFASPVRPRGSSQPAEQTVFALETPAPNSTVFGIVEVQGFAMDSRGISRITLMLNGQARHDADMNVPRADVRRRYVKLGIDSFPSGTVEPGFRTSLYAPNLPNGTHTLAIRVKFSNGDEAVLGERTITVDNTRTGQAPIGGIDLPRDPDTTGWKDMVSGVFPVTGWAIDDQGIRQWRVPAGCDLELDNDCKVVADIEVMVDGRVVGQALYPIPRPDVANAFPDVPDAKWSGFKVNVNTLAFSNGGYDLAVRVWDVEGNSRIIGRRPIYVENHGETLGPFGKIDWPMQNGHLISTSCLLTGGLPISPIPPYQECYHVDWVSGWVLDQNDPKLLEGVVSVSLHINGIEALNTARDYQPVDMYAYGGHIAYRVWANVYGLRRPDILHLYPQFDHAKQSGFFFALDTDYWLSKGILKIGLNELSIWARTKDPTRPAVKVDNVWVVLECPVRAGFFPAFGELERPEPMQQMSGTEMVRGWVFRGGWPGVARLNFYIDGVFDGFLAAPNPNFNMYRTDVEARFPWLPYPNSRFNGFQYTLDTTKYTDGPKMLVVEAVDVNGNKNYWVERWVVFDNHNRP